jgi:hypothetical protein
VVTVRFFKRLAGEGDISDGVPMPTGEGGDSEKRMPPPVGTKVRLLRDTVPMRKVRS